MLILPAVRRCAPTFAQGGGGGPEAPTYTPWLLSALSSGTNGANASNHFNNLSGRDTKMSNDIAGPFEESLVVKVTAATGASGNYGGSYLNSSVALSAGDETWIRKYCYFPSGFCAGCGGGGDFDSTLKFLRYQFVNGDRVTAKLGGFTNGSCASSASAPTMRGVASEIGVDGNNYDASPIVIPRDQWVALQWHLTHGTTTGASALEMWVNEEYSGSITIEGIHYPGSASNIDYLVEGDYWNGDVQESTFYYLSNIVATKETPNTLDGGGRPFIHPDHAVADF